MDLGLKGKTVIVTGGSSNIGRGILLGFAAEGSNIVNAEIDVEQGQKAVDQANALGGQATLVKTDVTDWDSVQAMVRRTLERFGQIDVLVNNAGGHPGQARFIKKKREEWAKEINLNYWGVHQLHQSGGGQHDRAQVWPHREHCFGLWADRLGRHRLCGVRWD